MQRHKSSRHVNAARARWRAAEACAQAARDDGIPDAPMAEDQRQPITLDLRSYGGPCLRIEPRLGYIAVRATDEDTGERHACALKTLLHRVADQLPRTLGARNLQ